MNRRSGGALLAVLLVGCTAGPDYHPPAGAMAGLPSATGPFSAVQGEAAFSQADLPQHWWRLYRDALLDSFVEEGLAANRDLRSADANLRRASDIVREAQAGALPTTTVSATGGLSRGLGSKVPLGDAGGYVLGAGVGYPLDLAGGIRRGIEAAKDDAETAQAARDEVRVTVAAAITRSYAAACAANLQYAVTQKVLEVQRRTFETTQRLHTVGRGASAFDVTRAQAAVQQSEAAVPLILAAKQAALLELGALMGRSPKDFPREAEQCSSPPVLPQPLPTGDGGALIRRRPDIRRAERTLAGATARIGVETAQLYPQVSLGGAVQLAGPPAAFGNASTLGASLGPLMSWTYPNRALARARIAAAGSAAEAAASDFDSTVIDALRQTETALSAYTRELDHHGVLTKVRDSDAVAASQAERLFRAGRTDFLSLLTAQANLANAEAALAQSETTVTDRQIDVFLALGGGWE